MVEARNAGDRINGTVVHKSAVSHRVFDQRSKAVDRRRCETKTYEYLGGTIRGQGGISLGINGMPDHVHVLAKLRPDKAVSDVLRDLKANASGWMHDIFPEIRDFSWQRGYGAFSVSFSQVEKVRRYIAEQEIHHQGRDFRDEFIALLVKNGVDFDARYLEI